MLKLRIFSFLILLLFPAAVFSEEAKLSEQEMLKLINQASGGIELYTTPDIPIENRNQYDFDGDGILEWVVVPKTACGDTKNCTFFVLQQEKKKKNWRILLKADGKLTSLSPWGALLAPSKTNGYTDILAVYDLGPEADGTRSLARNIYTWNGKNYEKSTAPYPPANASAEVTNFLREVDKLKRERSSAIKTIVE